MPRLKNSADTLDLPLLPVKYESLITRSDIEVDRVRQCARLQLVAGESAPIWIAAVLAAKVGAHDDTVTAWTHARLRNSMRALA
jgi:hypothetical protein